MKAQLVFAAGCLLAVLTASGGERSTIVVEPGTTRCIQGVSQLDRKRYFTVCDEGAGFDQRVPEVVYNELVKELGVSFGRSLGPVKKWKSRLVEDTSRPGYADLSVLKEFAPERPSKQFFADCGSNLHVAAHGAHNAYPEFMGTYVKGTSEHDGVPEYLPENLDAAAELAASVLKYGYTDFDRPAYFEPLNEPHWEFWNDSHLADWHLKTMEAVHEETPGVKVGGPCLSVAYFYRDKYRLWQGMKHFIDNTGGNMDFYSFHAYDFFQWKDGDFRGRVQSGLPLEGVLDLVQNYSMNRFGREVNLVVSEQGGYVLGKHGMYDGEEEAAQLAEKYFPGDSFENEMKKRSIVNGLMLRSVVANTLVFMDHPQVQKAVPFLLPVTWGWDPEYYAQLYVPYGCTDPSNPVATHLLDFYRFFKGVAGRRVKAACQDPDLQVRAFVDGSRLYLIVNNLSSRPKTAELQGIDVNSAEIRRLGRNPDFSGRYTEEIISFSKSLQLDGLEALILMADFDGPVVEAGKVNEIVCYGDQVAVPLQNADLNIKVPLDKKIEYAVLRIGLTRHVGFSHEPIITLNGRVLDVPLESCAERLEDREYAVTKMIPLDPKELCQTNRVQVSFADGDDGAVGTAVIRAAVVE